MDIPCPHGITHFLGRLPYYIYHFFCQPVVGSLKIFIESVNVELEKAGTTNRILNVSPGSIKGTSFNQGATDLSLTANLAQEIISHLKQKDDLFIPNYETVFKEVLKRYHDDFRKEGLHSYDYKLKSGRMK